jgi:predicted O-linked N-acetylglucosamine transferase (SPINDLY family)
MAEDLFLSTLQQITGSALGLGDVINAATTLVASGHADQAQELYKVWIGFNADSPQAFIAHFNCGCLQTQANDLAGATESMKSAIALNPDFQPAYINLGGLVERAGAVDNAIELWRAGLGRVPGVTAAALDFKLALLKQITRVQADQHRLADAETTLRDCLALAPHQRDVLEQYVAMRLGQCKWPALEPLESVDSQAQLAGMHPLSSAAYTDDPLFQLATAARYVGQAVNDKPIPLDFDRRHAAIDLSGRRLKVGYVSSDLREHAVGYLMSEMFELHDRAKVEVFAYYCGIPSDDGVNARIKLAVEHWLDIADMSDDEAARRIAADGIDILVDVNGHTRSARTGVFARRPAPIQVNWLGYPGTMGSPYHQYMVADAWIVPLEYELYCSEKVLRLPCYQPNDRKRIVWPERPSRASAGLPDDAMVFCCFNGSQKITRFTFDRWLDILKQVEGSVLWLLWSDDAVQQRLADYAELNGVARERLVFAPKMANPLHLARYPLADLFLDTSPYGAHTTASDALWMGVPVLTLSGRCFASRVCGSLVRAAGLPELVTESSADFIERAVALGRDRAAIAELKARLEAGRATCDLFNMEKLVASLEDLYAVMVEDHVRGRLPQPDLTNLDDYFQVGVALDHESRDLLAEADYHGIYKDGLALRHLARPLRPDSRLWTAADVLATDARPDSIDAQTRLGRAVRA